MKNDKRAAWWVSVGSIAYASCMLVALTGCGDSRDPCVLNGSIKKNFNLNIPYPYPIEEQPRVSDSAFYDRGVEYCYKGVIYVVFNPGVNNAVMSPVYDPLTSRVITCGERRQE